MADEDAHARSHSSVLVQTAARCVERRLSTNPHSGCGQLSVAGSAPRCQRPAVACQLAGAAAAGMSARRMERTREAASGAMEMP